MSEQSVSFVDLRFHTPAEQKRKRRPKHARVTEFPPSSPWLLTVILGLLCLALLVTARVWVAMVLQASHQVGRQNEELIQKQAILKNFTKLQEILKNCMQQRGDKCSSCPEGWIQHRRKCYHFTHERSSWEKSREYCSSHSSRLLRIENKEELDFINRLVCFHWIGLFRTGAATSWMWEDGTAYSTELFQVKRKEPGASCALLKAGEATSYNCTEQYRCICEKRAA
ncbi:natural killer cells antigen CD94-like [Malaclemys terrapin pileata]|uniref:natural killer cells antigen CD94-like n=1 Tax=Malaclemys terrapin pileata TaxID=2991368 RepID=UPI0023A910D8|nr:natural killer cells antigen CD94-like [Malaclemys terrapin pileata]